MKSNILNRSNSRRGWLTYVIAITTLIAVIISGILFHRIADKNRRIENSFVNIRLKAYEISTLLEWDMLDRNEIDQKTINNIKSNTENIKHSLHYLTIRESDRADIKVISKDFNKYFEYMNRELNLIQKGQFRQARSVHDVYLDPVFDNLVHQLTTSASNHQMLATKAFWRGDTIIEISIFVTLSLVMSLLWKLDHQRLMNEQTEKNQRLEQEMIKLEQLNLVGEMAAAIGHEVRNPMTSVRGFLQLFIEKENDPIKREHYDIMIQELDRANAIITEYLSLASDKKVCLKEKDLNEVIQRLLPLLQADAVMVDKYVEVEYGKIPNLLLDEAEIRQLILNLVKNGLEATAVGSIVKIRTYVENEKVFLQIEDQGTGLASEIIEKLGTPFVTTKENGTGLGLAVSCSIANRHKAELSYKTSSNGTTFFIQFKPA